jgi:hypothetical protein
MVAAVRCTPLTSSAKIMESITLPLMAADVGCSINALQALETPRVLNVHARAIGAAVRSERS